MYIKNYFQIILIFFGSIIFLFAEPPTHYFDVQNGLVEYEILGGAQLANETNLNMHGKSKLYFKEWGKVRQEEDNGIVVTTGAISYMQEVKRLEKHTNDKIINVDFENEQLLERKKIENISSQEKETKGLLHRGQDVIAGYLCAIWIGPSIKKCIYKGIVLKKESHVLGVSYSKVATSATFDMNETNMQCAMPDYPTQTFSLFKDNIKTKNSRSPNNICNIFKDITHSVDAKNKSFDANEIKDSKKREKFINTIAEDIFEKQKIVLPKLLEAMKKSRECLSLPENVSMLENCVENFYQSKHDMAIQEDDYNIFTDGKSKEKMLDEIEDAIIDFEPRMPCIKRSKNFIDLSSCMK